MSGKQDSARSALSARAGLRAGLTGRSATRLAVVTATLLGVAGLGSAAALAQPPSAAERQHAAWRSKIDSQLLQLHDASATAGPRAAERFAQQRALSLGADGQLQVELRGRLPPPAALQRHLRGCAARLQVAGSDRADVRVPLARLAALAAPPWVSAVRIPLAPLAMAVQSQGVALCGMQPYHCQKLNGQGANIAVVDVGFAGWGAAAAAGELPVDVATPADGGYPHGTHCAEVIADMAPGAKIAPVEVHSVAALQAWIAGPLAAQPVQVVSHSMGWFGESFGDGTGWLCQAAAALRAQGGVWVTAAGNLGLGSVWRGPWRDDDGDGWLEFASGDALNRFDGVATAQVLAVLDWQAYPATDIDLDLELCQVQGGVCKALANASGAQTGTQPPVETLSAVLPADGVYAWRVRKHPGALPKELRLSVVNPATGALQHFSTAKTLAHPADCAAAVAVAALPVGDYASGPVAAYSSRGPTSDGRAKPDLAGPAGVVTGQTQYFDGTSAACPHVAAAIAVHAQASGVSLAAAASAVVAAALPLAGAAVDDPASGHGKLFLALAGSGAACQPGSAQACQTSCGGAGLRPCSSACQLSACVAPAEVCNGQDDDCDGVTDDGFACSGAATLACDTACGTQGTRSCDSNCSWAACKAPAESCNGQDDDCDGQSDEGFACVRDSAEACTTADGRPGTAQCGSDCALATCRADEVCNGQDDDGDGQIDNGLACPAAQAGWCSAGRPSGRGAAGAPWSLALLFAVVALVRRRRSATAQRC